MQNALWPAPVTAAAAAAAASCANKMATHEIRLPRCTSGDRTDRAQQTETATALQLRQQQRCDCNGNIAKLINIFKYLSHCLPQLQQQLLACIQLQIRVESAVCLLKNHFTVSCLAVIAPTRRFAASLPGYLTSLSSLGSTARPRPSLVQCIAASCIVCAASSSSRSVSVSGRDLRRS